MSRVRSRIRLLPFRVAQPVLDLLTECVNPGDQRPQPPRVDFLLEPADLIAQDSYK